MALEKEGQAGFAQGMGRGGLGGRRRLGGLDEWGYGSSGGNGVRWSW